MRRTLLALLSSTALAFVGLPATAATSPPSEATPNWDITSQPGTRTPASVRGIHEAQSTPRPAEAARRHLDRHPSLYGIDDSGHDLELLGTTEVGQLTTVRFRQRHHGVPVFGGHYLVRLTRQGTDLTVTGAGGRYFTGLTTGTTPKVSERVAGERAKRDVARQLRRNWVTVPSDQAVPRLQATVQGLVVLPRGSGVLTYHVTVRGTDPAHGRPVLREVYVDALQGFPVLDYSGIRDAAAPGTSGTGETLDGNTVPIAVSYDDELEAYQLRDLSRNFPASGNAITTWDARDYGVTQVTGELWPDGLEIFASGTPHFSGAVSEAGAVDAHWAAGTVYDFYRDQFGRRGLDGQDGAIKSLVGVNYFGQPYNNAFWDGHKMVYGGGDAEYKPFSASLDVVGHEMTHGVIEHSAGLVYLGQPGALNEALADYFGNAIDVTTSGTEMSDPDAGLIGEDLCRTLDARACALRDLNDGATIRDDFVGVTTAWDSGGVHLNSTIFSGALWDIRESLGPELADKIIYTALTGYLTPLDGFYEGRLAVLEAADELEVKGRALRQIRDAFDAHGITRNWEQKLRKDSVELWGNVTTTRTGTDAAAGWWVTSNSNDSGVEPYAVYAGRTTERGRDEPRRLSPDDGRYHVYPATDGVSATWVAYGTSRAEVLSAPLTGGPSQVIATVGAPGEVTHPAVSGDSYAFQVSHPRGGTHVMLKRPTDERAFLVDGGAHTVATALPTLHDGKLAYVKSWFDPREGVSHVAVEVMDLSTGERITLPPVEGVDGYAPRVGQPVLTGQHLFWLVDRHADDGRAGIWRADTDGSAPQEIVAETEPGAPAPTGLDATSEAITFDDWPVADPTDQLGATLPTLYQARPDGSQQRRFSCDRGAQTWFSADTGRRVVWLDGTTGRTDLVTRHRPTGIGRCS